MLHPERPGDQSWRLHIRLHASRNKLRTCGYRSCWVDRQRCHRKRLGCTADTVCWVKWRILVGAIAKRVLEIVVHSESCAKHGFVRERAPRESYAGLRQEFRIVRREERVSDMRSA